MSADNYYVVRKAGDKFVVLMGFASDPHEPQVKDGEAYVLYDDPVTALLAAQQLDSEYGASLHPECASAAPKLSKKDQP